MKTFIYTSINHLVDLGAYAVVVAEDKEEARLAVVKFLASHNIHQAVMQGDVTELNTDISQVTFFTSE